MKKKFELSVEDAGGPIQLCFVSKDGGRRLLGNKGSPYKKIIHKWLLTEQEAEKFIEDIKMVIQESEG